MTFISDRLNNYNLEIQQILAEAEAVQTDLNNHAQYVNAKVEKAVSTAMSIQTKQLHRIADAAELATAAEQEFDLSSVLEF